MSTYISGPMRGIKHFNFPAFRECERYLRNVVFDRDGEYFNPARHDAEVLGMGWEPDENQTISESDLHAWMRKDLTEVAKADDLVLLPGWSSSVGARREASVALWCGLDLWTYVIPVSGPRLHRLRGDDVAGLAFPSEGLDKTDTVSPVRDVIEGTTAAQAAFQSHADAIDEFRKVPDYRDYSAGWQANPAEVRSRNPLTGGEKGVKPARYDLLPTRPLEAVARHYGVGARKYEDRNWEKGYEWSKSFAALQRHAWAMWGGEDIDPETGSPHLAAVVFHALAMLEWADTHPELDDRVKPNPSLREVVEKALQ